MEKINFRKSSVKTKIIYIFFFIIFVSFAVVCLYPMYWAIINSLKTMEDFVNNPLLLPSEWRFINYVNVFTEFTVAAEGVGGQEFYKYFFLKWNFFIKTPLQPECFVI